MTSICDDCLAICNRKQLKTYKVKPSDPKVELSEIYEACPSRHKSVRVQ